MNPEYQSATSFQVSPVKTSHGQIEALARAENPQNAITSIAASIRAVGLIQRSSFSRKRLFLILDGYVRYRILLEMGVETIPCIIWKEKDAFLPTGW